MAEKVHVLIVGAGPTGLVAALWMAQLGIRARFIDKRGTRVLNGHADGLQSRTSKSLIVSAWQRALLRSLQRFSKPVIGFPATTLHQGHIEAALLNAIRNRSNIDVERGIEPVSLQVDEVNVDDPVVYPIIVELHYLENDVVETTQTNAHRVEGDHTIPVVGSGQSDNDGLVANSDPRAGTKEMVQAKYLLACEGAHSWTRRQLGFTMEGESHDEFWGVIDVVPITDFPDIRKFCTVQTSVGTVLVIPRERGLVRLYVQLAPKDTIESTQKSTRIIYTPADFLAAANQVIAPYTIRYTYFDWWTVFQVGRRVSNHYALHERIFLARGYDYDRVYTNVPTDLSGSKFAGDVYQYYGIDSQKGCVVVTRPDQHVGYIGALNKGLEGLKEYLDGVFVK